MSLTAAAAAAAAVANGTDRKTTARPQRRALPHQQQQLKQQQQQLRQPSLTSVARPVCAGGAGGDAGVRVDPGARSQDSYSAGDSTSGSSGDGTDCGRKEGCVDDGDDGDGGGGEKSLTASHGAARGDTLPPTAAGLSRGGSGSTTVRTAAVGARAQELAAARFAGMRSDAEAKSAAAAAAAAAGNGTPSSGEKSESSAASSFAKGTC